MTRPPALFATVPMTRRSLVTSTSGEGSSSQTEVDGKKSHAPRRCVLPAPAKPMRVNPRPFTKTRMCTSPEVRTSTHSRRVKLGDLPYFHLRNRSEEHTSELQSQSNL